MKLNYNQLIPLFIIIQLLIIVYFWYIISKKLKEIEYKRMGIKKHQEEFEDFLKLVREIMDEYNAVFDFLISDLEKKIKKVDEIQMNFRNIEDMFELYQERSAAFFNKQKNEPRKEDDFKQLEKKEYKKVFELAREGLDITEIAKKVDIGKGEVSLLLNLKQKNRDKFTK